MVTKTFEAKELYSLISANRSYIFNCTEDVFLLLNFVT